MISIPIMNHLSTEKTRGEYLRILREAGAGRVFLCPSNPFGDEEKAGPVFSLLRENLAFYRENGIEPGVWIGGLGHGGALAHETEVRAGNYTKIRGLGNGGEAGDSFCPLDPEFRGMYRAYVRRIAETGARIIMIDDDLRLALHGPVALGCACPLHLREFSRRAFEAGLCEEGYAYTREELAAVLFTGKPNPLRQIWLGLMGDTLRDFARELREEVDSVDPAIRLGHCACLPTWDTDGVDSAQLALIFAGSRARPFLRLIGAPYWNNGGGFGSTGLGSLCDLERMQFSWVRERYGDRIELMSEGDVYPRPRTVTPSSYLEGFHEVLTADGEPDILKYMLDYGFDTAYETGYVRRHLLTAGLREKIAGAFRGTVPAGIYIFEAMKTLGDLDCAGISESALASRLLPASVNFANALSLPVAFSKSEFTPAVLIAGESAKTAPDCLVNAPLPLILDVRAAEILAERGFDVGIAGFAPLPKPDREVYPREGGRSIPISGEIRPNAFRALTPKEGAETDSYFLRGSETFPAVLRYVRGNGAPVIVYAFGFDAVGMGSALVRNYCRGEQIFRLIPRVPVQIRKEPGAYVLCRSSGEGMTVGIWNFGRDWLAPEEIGLGDAYRNLSVYADTASVGSLLRLSEDGRRVLISDPAEKELPTDAPGMIPPFGFLGFAVKK